MADKPISVVPDTGTAEAARLAAEHTGNPGRWVRLDCQDIRHVQQPVEQAPLFKAPSSPVGQESPYWCALETSRSGVVLATGAPLGPRSLLLVAQRNHCCGIVRLRRSG